MADRRRRRASQDTDEEEDDVPQSELEVVPSVPCILDLSGVQAREAESECESEDGIEGDAVVLSDYESAEENGSQKSEEDGEEYSEEEVPKEGARTSNKGDEDESSKEGKPEEKGEITGERQSGDGQESTEPVENKMGKKSRRQLDDDEDRKNPAYIPRKGLFFEHDLRGHTEPEEVRPKVRQRKLWKDEGRWVHDKFQEDEQAPKSRDELISLYGYDIRLDRNPDEIRPRRIRKPRFRSPQNRDSDWIEKPPPRPYLRKTVNSIPSTRTFNRRIGGQERKSPAKNYFKNVSCVEDDEIVKPNEVNSSRSYHSSGELSTSEDKMDAKNIEQGHVKETVIITDCLQSVKSYGVTREDGSVQNQSLPTENMPQVQEKTIEKKSYSRIRRTRNKVTEVGKPQSVEDTPVPGLVPAAQQIPIQPLPPPVTKTGSWETPSIDSAVTGLECEMTQMNLSGKSWTPNSQPQYAQSRDLQGIPNSLHMNASQYNRVEEMGSQARRAKRYSSQRQRPVPETPPPPPPPAPAPALGPAPAPGPAPMHIGLMEGHYYDTLQFQGPIYTHSESSAPLPPQGMIVQPDMHLPHPVPGFNHHQSPGHLTNTGLYAPQVPLPSGQPPPPQVLPPPFFTSGMMNYGNPSYPYTTGGLPPHIYPTTQAQSQVFGGVTYYNTVQQQALPKPSPPRRQSQPVTVKPPPPEDSRSEKLKERNEA